MIWKPKSTKPHDVSLNSQLSTLNMSLSTTIKSIQDIMRKDVGVDGDAQRISQLVWLLFLKIFDAQEEEMDEMGLD